MRPVREHDAACCVSLLPARPSAQTEPACSSPTLLPPAAIEEVLLITGGVTPQVIRPDDRTAWLP